MLKAWTLVIVALIASSPAAAKTFKFTGTVTTSTGVFAGIAAGTPVSGTYTFSYANAVSQFSQGAVGSTTAAWSARQETGTHAGILPPSSAYVFSFTAKIGALTLCSCTPGAYSSASAVQNGSEAGSISTELHAGNQNDFQLGTSAITRMDVTNPSGAYTKAGLPIVAGTTSISGGYEISQNSASVGSITWNITSLK